jgi:hypothetical protein
MKHKLLILSTMILGAMGAQSALAQSGTAGATPPSTETSPATRSDVRDQTLQDKAVPRADKAPPAVDDTLKTTAQKTSPTGTAKAPSRSEVKSEGIRAQNAGEIPKGDAATTRVLERKKGAAEPAKSRQEVNAEVPSDRSPARGELNKEKNEPKSATGLR